MIYTNYRDTRDLVIQDLENCGQFLGSFALDRLVYELLNFDGDVDHDTYWEIVWEHVNDADDEYVESHS